MGPGRAEQNSTSLYAPKSQENALIPAITVQREDAGICLDESGVELSGFGDQNQQCDPMFLASEFLPGCYELNLNKCRPFVSEVQ